MVKLLIPLLTVIALPTAVNAETWYFLGRANKANHWTVPMPSKEQCESEGKRFFDARSGDNWQGVLSFPAYICIKGK